MYYVHIICILYTHTHLHTYIHTYIQTYTHIYIYTYIYTHIYIYTYIPVHIHIYKYIYTYIHIYIYNTHIYIYTYTYIYTYIYVYIILMVTHGHLRYFVLCFFEPPWVFWSLVVQFRSGPVRFRSLPFPPASQSLFLRFSSGGVVSVVFSCLFACLLCWI